MKDEGKTKKQLINELGEIRLRILELEEFEKEYKQSVVSLKDSEEKFRLIGENTSDLISIVGLNGKYVYVSPSYKLFGYDPDKLIGKDGFKILHPEDKKQFLPMIKQAISGIFKAGEERRLDIRLRDKAGNYHDVESIAKLIKNDSGNIQILSVVRDVTEQRRVEKEIVNSHNQLESFFKAVPAGIGVVVDRKFQFVNSKLIEMLGYAKEELIGNLSKMIYPGNTELERVRKYKYEQIKEKSVGTIETVFQRKDGSLIDVLFSSAPINVKDLSEGVTFTAFDITESKQVKEELEEKEATYRLVRENTSDLISIVGLDGKFIYVSPSYKLLGYNPEELIGVDGLTFLHPKDKKNLYPIYKQVVSGFFKDNKEKRFEFRFLDGAGNYRDAESLVKLIKDDSGKRQILSVVRDITERKKMEDELRESEEKYRLLFNALPYGGEVMDTEGYIKECSESNADLLGYRREELIGKHITNFLPPKSKEIFQTLFPKLLNGESAQAEIRMIHKDGRFINIIRTARPILDEQGNIVRVLATNTNITERKKAENKLIESEAKFRLLANYTHDWEYWIDPDGNYTYISPSCERITGYSSEEISSKPELLFEIVRPDHSKKIQKHYKNENNKETSLRTLEFPIITKDGEERWLAHNCFPIYNDQGDYLGRRGNNRDITDRKLAEEELRQYENIVSSSTDMLALLDMDYVYLAANSAYIEAFNVTREELIGKAVTDLIGKEKFEENIKPMAQQCFAGEQVNFQRENNPSVCGSGYMDVTFYPYLDQNNEVKGFVINGRDITKQKQTESDLLKNQFLLTKAQELGQIGTWELDIQKNVLIWTDEIYKIFGVPFGPELDYEQFLGYLHPDDRAYVDEKWNAALNHEPYDIEHRVIVDDAVKWVREKADIEFDTQGKAVLAIGFTQDITYRKQAMEELNRYENIVSSSTDMLALLDKEYVYLAANSAYFEAFKLTQEDLIGKTVTEVFGKEFFEKTIRSHAQQCLSGEQVNFQDWIDFPAYEAQYMDINYYPYLDHANKAIGFVVNARDITARKQAEDSVRQEQETAQNYLDIAGVMMLALDDKGAVTLINKKGCEILGYEEKDILGENWFELILPKAAVSDVKSVLQQLMQGEIENVERYENPVITSSGEERMIYWRNSIIKDENGKITGILSSGEDVTDRREAEAQLNLQSHALESAANAILITDPKGSIRWVNPAFTALAGYSIEEVVGQNPRVFKSGQHDEAFYRQMWETISAGEIWKGKVINKRKDGMLYNEEMTIAPVLSEDGEISNFVAIKQDITERVQAEETIKRQHQFTSALHDIDLAITSSQDLNLTLNILIKHTLAQLEADAVAIFLLDQDLHMLSFEVGTGFANNSSIRTGTVKLGESLAGKVALERKLLILDFENEEICSDFSELVRVEQFVTYAGAPLIAKGLVLGVIEIYQRTPLDPDPEWIRSFETLAGQAAIAIENISLFNDLQRANLELGLGYEQTIEGWAKTLEMRDAETEGHSQRVTDMTMKLARQMGIKAEELVHVRRGALLHDIGKMNVPDSIMQKEGELDGAEWEIMKKHTEYAYQFLSPIQFLAPALDIPQYHHERWDGTGYPHGLKGEQIPLPARIFAIVDVFDALCSDRPYRKAWSMKKVINHLKEQSGKHFDPAVVEAFLQIQK